MRGVSHSRAIASFRAPRIVFSLAAHQPDGLPLPVSQFSQFFVCTPQDLIHDGLYKTLALALHPPPFNKVSCCLVARALGAVRITGRAHLRAVEVLSATCRSSTSSGPPNSLQNVQVEPVEPTVQVDPDAATV